MKNKSILMAVLVMAALAVAPLGSAFASEGTKTHQLTATIVSMDEKAHTITFTTDSGEQKTAPVMGKAISELKSVKAGEKVTLTCTDKATGEHEGVSAIHAVAAASAKK
jgi:c-di-GMP-binding flagellar brake protein YcgR